MRHRLPTIISALTAALVLAACGDSTTASGPSAQSSNGITVLSPNGGESFRIGGSLRIRWTADTSSLTDAMIQIGCSGSEWYKLTGTGSIKYQLRDTTFAITDSIYSDLQHKWVAFPTGSNCKVRIQDYQIKTSIDTSDASFTVAPR